ncbi:MAG: hypothetical protein V3V20_05230, partial [Algisphaera sp.]
EGKWPATLPFLASWRKAFRPINKVSFAALASFVPLRLRDVVFALGYYARILPHNNKPPTACLSLSHSAPSSLGHVTQHGMENAAIAVIIDFDTGIAPGGRGTFAALRFQCSMVTLRVTPH